ncbi:GATA-type zinc finger protein 1 [Savitreella phatthalungensis]
MSFPSSIGLAALAEAADHVEIAAAARSSSSARGEGGSSGGSSGSRASTSHGSPTAVGISDETFAAMLSGVSGSMSGSVSTDRNHHNNLLGRQHSSGHNVGGASTYSGTHFGNPDGPHGNHPHLGGHHGGGSSGSNGRRINTGAKERKAQADDGTPLITGFEMDSDNDSANTPISTHHNQLANPPFSASMLQYLNGGGYDGSSSAGGSPAPSATDPSMKKRKRKSSAEDQLASGMEDTTGTFDSPTGGNSPVDGEKKKRKHPTPRPDKQCSECGTRETSVWRRHLDGELLCNKCGLRFRKQVIKEQKAAGTYQAMPRGPKPKFKGDQQMRQQQQRQELQQQRQQQQLQAAQAKAATNSSSSGVPQPRHEAPQPHLLQDGATAGGKPDPEEQRLANVAAAELEAQASPRTMHLMQIDPALIAEAVARANDLESSPSNGATGTETAGGRADQPSRSQGSATSNGLLDLSQFGMSSSPQPRIPQHDRSAARNAPQPHAKQQPLHQQALHNQQQQQQQQQQQHNQQQGSTSPATPTPSKTPAQMPLVSAERACRSCNTRWSPAWRKRADGAPLCNSCYLRERRRQGKVKPKDVVAKERVAAAAAAAASGDASTDPTAKSKTTKDQKPSSHAPSTLPPAPDAADLAAFTPFDPLISAGLYDQSGSKTPTAQQSSKPSGGNGRVCSSCGTSGELVMLKPLPQGSIQPSAPSSTPASRRSSPTPKDSAASSGVDRLACAYCAPALFAPSMTAPTTADDDDKPKRGANLDYASAAAAALLRSEHEANPIDYNKLGLSSSQHQHQQQRQS